MKEEGGQLLRGIVVQVWDRLTWPTGPTYLANGTRCQALEQAAQGGGGVTIPGVVQKTSRCGTSGRGLAGMVSWGDGWP